MNTNFLKTFQMLAFACVILLLSTFLGCKKEEQVISNQTASIKTPKNLRLNSGITIKYDGNMLAFNNRADFNTVINELNDGLKAEILSPNDEDPVTFDPIHPSLDLFEEELGFTSFRNFDEHKNWVKLSKGANPKELHDDYILDPVYSTLLNTKGQVKIADSIFWETPKVEYVITSGSLETLHKIETGTNPYELLDVQINWQIPVILTPDETESAVYATSINSFTREVTFEYSGENGSLVFNFGDGTTSNAVTVTSNTATTTHTYASSGNYTVQALLIPVSGNGVVSSNTTVLLQNPCGQASVSFDYAAVPNTTSILFQNKSRAFSSVPGAAAITSWHWDFGDGQTSNQQNPLHIYGCAGDFDVILTITTFGGCSYTSTPFKVKVPSLTCQGQVNTKHIDVWKSYEYAGGDGLVKYYVLTRSNWLLGKSYLCKIQHFRKIHYLGLTNWWNWEARPADMDIHATGDVYLKGNSTSSGLCTYTSSFALNDMAGCTNAVDLVMNRAMGDYFKTTQSNPWTVKWSWNYNSSQEAIQRPVNEFDISCED